MALIVLQRSLATWGARIYDGFSARSCRSAVLNLSIRVVTEDFAVAGQLCAADMAAVAAAGYRSVIINRPDFEEGPDQPRSVDVIDAACAVGLCVEYQPVISGGATDDDVRRFAELLEQLPRPTLAYCRSGARCMGLYKAALRV